MLSFLRIVLAALLVSIPAAAVDFAGCWEGTVGDGPPAERIAFLEFGDGRLIATIADGTLKEAAGPFTVANGVVTATLVREGREIPLRLERDPETGALTGALTHPDAGEQRLRFTPVDAYEHTGAALGAWGGTLQAVGLPLVLRIEPAPCGRLICVVDSPSQGAVGMPCTSFAFDDEKAISFGLSYLSARYEGTIDAAGETLDGVFRQGGSLPLTFERGREAPEQNRPQEPRPPFPYTAEDVTIDNVKAGITLAGTLSVPPGDGPHPLAIFITGSGPQNRDEELMGHKPFLVLADALTRAGVAVLRTDDRGVGGSGGDTMQSTLDDVAGDVVALIEWARARPEIDSKRIGLVGHSEGGWVAPLVANRERDLAFMVFIAGPGVSGTRILESQTARILEVAGLEPAAVEAVVEYNRAIYKVLRKKLSDDATVERIVKAWSKLDATFDDELRTTVYTAMQVPADGVADHIRSQLGMIATPWFRHLLEFDPRPSLAKLDVPLLALLGEKDVQVPAAENARVLRDVLRANARDTVRVEVMPGLNHLMQQAETGSILEYGMIEETINPRALELIESWLVKTAGIGPG